MSQATFSTVFGSEYEMSKLGKQMQELCSDLFPICRSVTGPGVRKTLSKLAEYVDLQSYEIPSGQPLFDWTVPQEWTCKESFIENEKGNRVVDFRNHSLHVMGYSSAINAIMDRVELDRHLFRLPDQQDLIPCRTSYYDENWGFCVSENQRRPLGDGPFRVKIDSCLKPGSLTYGEVFIPGQVDEEILISTHGCHPSLANDNLSGIAVATFLARILSERKAKLHYGVRIIFVPATIGVITWLAENQDIRSRIIGGLVLSGVGDSGKLTYKKSRRGEDLMDLLLPPQMEKMGVSHMVREYVPYGYDERQFCSPGLNLPMGCLMRTPFGEYPEYHTSGDNLEFISAPQLTETLSVTLNTLEMSQFVSKFENLQPFCEPQLGRRGLYDAIGGDNDQKQAQMALLWMLAYSDSANTTLDIEAQSGLPITDLCLAAQRLEGAQLLRTVPSLND